MLSATEKIKVVLNREGMTVKDLAELMGTSRQNLHSKLSKNNLSESDLEKICNLLNITYEITFTLQNGERI